MKSFGWVRRDGQRQKSQGGTIELLACVLLISAGVLFLAWVISGRGKRKREAIGVEVKTLHIIIPRTDSCRAWMQTQISGEAWVVSGLITRHEDLEGILQRMLQAGFSRGEDFRIDLEKWGGN